jgi:hypothetical protein
VVGLERLGRGQRGFDAGGGKRGQQRGCGRLVDLYAPDARAPLAAAFHQNAAGTVVGGTRVVALALIVDFELASAASADSDPLRQCLAFADRAGALVRAGTSVTPSRARCRSASAGTAAPPGLLAQPQPYLPRGAELGEAIEDRLDRAAQRLGAGQTVWSAGCS